MTKLPALFVGHGSPMLALEPNNPFNQNFRAIIQTFAKPSSILMISAHWYGSKLAVTHQANPPLIYDFYGFPEELSQVRYPASGSPELAEQVQQLLEPLAVELDETRGLDHGAWAVLKHLYPEADIPVVQLRLDLSKPLTWHFALGQKLKTLREQGVLIIGSGNIVHNLRAISYEHIDQIGVGYEWAIAFRDQINHAIMTGDTQQLIEFERLGEIARLSVPSVEHYLPLLYIMALREEGESVSLFNDELVGGSLSMTSVRVGA